MLQSITLEDVLNNTNNNNISIEDISIEDTLLDYNNSIIEYMELENAITTINTAIKIKGNELSKDYILQLEATNTSLFDKLKDVIIQIIDAITRFLQQITAGMQDKIYDKTFSKFKELGFSNDAQIKNVITNHDIVKLQPINIYIYKQDPIVFLNKIFTLIKSISEIKTFSINKIMEEITNTTKNSKINRAETLTKFETLADDFNNAIKTLGINVTLQSDYSEYKKYIYELIYKYDEKRDIYMKDLYDKENQASIWGKFATYQGLLDSANNQFKENFRKMRSNIDITLSTIKPFIKKEFQNVDEHEMEITKVFRFIFQNIKAIQNLIAISWNIYYNAKQDAFKIVNTIMKPTHTDTVPYK